VSLDADQKKRLENTQRQRIEDVAKIKKNDSLFIATPVHSEVSLHYMKSCLDLQKECLLNHTSITFQIMKSSLVTQGRNLCVSAFLSSKATHMCFIDSDIAFSPRSIYRMFASPYEVSCVPYPMKTTYREKFVHDYKKRPDADLESLGHIFPVEIPNLEHITIKEGFLEINKGPAGCMMIKRSALEKLVKEYPELTIKQKTMINGKLVDKPNYYNFFDTYWSNKDKTYLGEDFYFCKLWTSMGGKIHALVDESIDHIGESIYRGRLLDELSKIDPKKPPSKPIKKFYPTT